jgi:SAM-dependent methyltransferase
MGKALFPPSREWKIPTDISGDPVTLANREQLIKSWKGEEQRPFTGWDFSYLDGRMLEEQPSWSYAARAAELMRQSSTLLDMGTGGGERLLALREHWPEEAVVTEDYPPSVKLATERLAPLGVRVVEAALTDAEPMPFADGEFDLVLNRHSGLNPKEVARVLAPGGVFLSQQVHGLWGQDLLAAFGAEPAWPHETLDHTVSHLEAAGLTIVAAEDWSGTFSFTDVGAIVYYLKAIPWLVEGFSVETHLDSLLALQDRLELGKGLVFEARKYLVEARKPGSPNR